MLIIENTLFKLLLLRVAKSTDKENQQLNNKERLGITMI